MLKRSRVSGKMDMSRLAAALRSPGIDPRQWVALCAVVDFKLDLDEGAFADVVILSTGQQETVRVGAFYAGPGFGFYAPLEKDDEVLVAFPDGAFDHGGVVVARLWSPSDPPAQLAKDHDADVAIQIKKDANLRIQVFGDGNVVLGAENGKVLLGDEMGTKPVHRKGDHEDVGSLTLTLTGTTTLSGTYVDPDGNSTPVTSGTPILLKGKANEGSSKVESS
jgi:hypothetical protein